MEYEGIKFYFIDNEGYFTDFRPYGDNALFEIEKFAYFSKAVLSASKTEDANVEVVDKIVDVIGKNADYTRHNWKAGRAYNCTTAVRNSNCNMYWP